jgi:hypothetical protein
MFDKFSENSSGNPQQLKNFKVLFPSVEVYLEMLSKTNILLTLMCIGAHKFLEKLFAANKLLSINLFQ